MTNINLSALNATFSIVAVADSYAWYLDCYEAWQAAMGTAIDCQDYLFFVNGEQVTRKVFITAAEETREAKYLNMMETHKYVKAQNGFTGRKTVIVKQSCMCFDNGRMLVDGCVCR